MPDRKLIRHAFVALLLLGLLLVISTLNCAFHHHQSFASESGCPICHLSHQPIAPAMASDRLPTLLPAGSGPEPLDDEFAPNPMIRRVPARAPPSV